MRYWLSNRPKKDWERDREREGGRKEGEWEKDREREWEGERIREGEMGMKERVWEREEETQTWKESEREMNKRALFMYVDEETNSRKKKRCKSSLYASI